jgi:hypothetical protein
MFSFERLRLLLYLGLLHGGLEIGTCKYVVVFYPKKLNFFSAVNFKIFGREDLGSESVWYSA